LGSNPLKRANNQITVQSSAGATHHSKYIHLLEDERVLYPITLVDLDMLVSLFTRYYDNFDMNTRVLVLLTKTYWPV
jgi:restriction system protein